MADEEDMADEDGTEDEEEEGYDQKMEEDPSFENESDYLIPGIPDDSATTINGAKSPKTSKMESATQGTTIVEKLSMQGKMDQEALEETSKSEEGIRESPKVPLSVKKSSLEQVQRPKASRLHRQCQRRFREIIGKRETKNEELEKQQGDLRQRLNILECSMPAVMVWNVWRMTQGASVPNLQRALEKQFQGPASGEVYCPSTPSRHFDCRVREVEAERKQAQKRVEDARTLWAEKMAALEDKGRKLEEAKKCREDRKERIERLTAEAQKLKEAKEAVVDDGSCETGEVLSDDMFLKMAAGTPG